MNLLLLLFRNTPDESVSMQHTSYMHTYVFIFCRHHHPHFTTKLLVWLRISKLIMIAP